MIEELKRFLSQFSWKQGSKVYLNVKRTKEQSKKRKYTMIVFSFLSLLLFMTIWFLIMNIENVGISMFSMFNNRIVTYDLLSLYIMMPMLIIFVLFVIGWSYLHSRFSPVKNYRLIALLQHASSELDLLRDYKLSQVEVPIKEIEWNFCYKKDDLFIELLTGGHLTEEQENDVDRKLTKFLIKQTHKKDEWVLVDSFIDDLVGTINMVYGPARGRFIIDNIDDTYTVDGLLKLDTEFFFNPRKQVHLICVGRTGSAKTTLLKVCLLEVISDIRNRVFICDGKSSYLSTVGHSISNSKTATTGQELLEMLDEIVDIVSVRYLKMKSNVDEERDLTYLDMYHDDGHVYFIFDEILALFTRVEASDKLLKPAERLLPKIQALFAEILQLGRQANVHVILSGQQIPATILPTSSREAFGARLVLGRTDPANAIEILGVGKNVLPNVDTSNYGALIWLDGHGWDKPKFMELPYISSDLKYKETLRKLTNK